VPGVFRDVVRSAAHLEGLYPSPSPLVAAKKRPTLDEVSTAFVAHSPFVLLATADGEGRCDVSPRGGPPGFVKVLDAGTLVVPDLNGNNLLDSIRNVVTNGRAGLLFLIPGHDETLRVNGRACITTDPAVLDLFAQEVRRPKVAVGVEIEEVYVHCAKAFRRGGVWQPDTWPLDVPDGVDILRCQYKLEDSKESLRTAFEEGYAAELAADRPE
jgi:PPOX class probable FMN-dependent enzyme